MLSSREKAALTYRKRADAEIDAHIAQRTLFGFRTIVSHAVWDGHLRQVVVRCKCGKLETVKYSTLKTKVRQGKMRQCRDCGNEGKSGENNPWFSGGGKRGEGVWRATNRYKRLHPNCERCGSPENVHVDHKEPVSRRPDLATTESNFESLCAVCHAQKTLEDGMAHVVPMILAGRKSSAVPASCAHCNSPILFYPSRENSPQYCSMRCKGLAMRKIAPETEMSLVSAYLAGEGSTKTVGKIFGVSADTAREILLRNGVKKETISAIGDINKAKAKRSPAARRSASQKSIGRSSKLDEPTVMEIKRALAAGLLRQADIAQAHGVSVSTIEAISSGRNWAWVAI